MLLIWLKDLKNKYELWMLDERKKMRMAGIYKGRDILLNKKVLFDEKKNIRVEFYTINIT